MSSDNQSKKIYYKARDDMQINGLPYFFGWVEFKSEKIVGEHYKPKIDQFTKIHHIGYYKIQGRAADFLYSLEGQDLVEITREEFDSILVQWIGVDKDAPVCWGLGLVSEIAKAM